MKNKMWVMTRPEGRAPGALDHVRSGVFVALLLVGMVGRMAAHDGPEDVIATLTQRMSKAGRRPDF